MSVVLVLPHSTYSFKRDEYVHLGNTTNNRLECHNQKLKDLTSRTSSPCEMFQNVIHFTHTAEAEYKRSSFTEEFTSVTTADDGICGVPEIQAACTHYAATLIVEQFKLAHSVGYRITGKDGRHVLESSSGRLHTLSNNDDVGSACLCSFHQTLRMPCHHIFATRQKNANTMRKNGYRIFTVWNGRVQKTVCRGSDHYQILRV